MWRQNPFQGNHDSDQSISDEEELDDVWPENYVSLNVSARDKEELPLPVRLDFLRGSSEQSLAGKVSCSSQEKPTGSPLEDEVEMPDFEEGDFSSLLGVTVANTSDEEIVSEDEGNNVLSKVVMGFGNGGLHKHDHHFVSHEQVRNIDEESEAILPVNESASCSAFKAACSSKANRSGDGIWSKTKPKFSLQLLLDKVGHPCISNGENSVPFEIHRLPETLEGVDSDTSANSVENSLEDDDRKEKHSESELAEVEALAHQSNQHSMAELFDNLQDKTNLLCGNSRKHSQRIGKRVQFFLEKSVSNTEDRVVDSEDSPEFMDSGSSSDSEIHDRNMKIAFPEKKKQTMADRFQEALGASYIADEGTHVAVLKPLRARIFGNLQQVMQKEKERDMDFWKTLPAGANPDSELGGIVVKIISRSLDAKLTVCHCLSGKYNENSLDSFKGLVYGGWERTIIFSPRVCNDVDLEVGNLIRIHPPWKEVRVGNDNNIILCTYFTQIP